MATSGGITIRIHGLNELRGKLNGRRADAPVSRFLDRGAIFIQSRARENAPVDRGQLRNRIGVEKPTTRSRRIGPNLPYGEFVETGTRPHFPPPAALDGWAKRHGFPNGFVVARMIARKGTRAQPYMGPAAEAAEGHIRTLVPILAAEIESAYAR